MSTNSLDDEQQRLLAAGASSTADGRTWTPPSPDALQGVFPNLQILELIGQGGMGAVYKARQTHLDRVVAVKLLAPHLTSQVDFAQRFQREAMVLARLSHPHIVALYDVGESGPWRYLVMEYVDGATLRQVLTTGPFTASAALTLAPQLCEALSYAHAQGIIHRDLKPENILIDASGKGHIADFGLAMLRDGTIAMSITKTGDVLGTAAYMAPEQLSGSRDIDHRADLYALGVIIYEMLTGHLPLGRFEVPSHRGRLDVRIDSVVLQALERTPELRWQSAEEMRRAVDALKPGAPPAARTPTQRWRQPVIWAGAALLLLFASVGMWNLGTRLFDVLNYRTPVAPDYGMSQDSTSTSVSATPSLEAAPSPLPITAPSSGNAASAPALSSTAGNDSLLIIEQVAKVTPAAEERFLTEANELNAIMTKNASRGWKPWFGIRPQDGGLALVFGEVAPHVYGINQQQFTEFANILQQVRHYHCQWVPISLATPANTPSTPFSLPAVPPPATQTMSDAEALTNALTPPAISAPAQVIAAPAVVSPDPSALLGHHLIIVGPGELTLEADAEVTDARELHDDPSSGLTISSPNPHDLVLTLTLRQSHVHLRIPPRMLETLRFAGSGRVLLRGCQSDQLVVEHRGSGTLDMSDLQVKRLELVHDSNFLSRLSGHVDVLTLELSSNVVAGVIEVPAADGSEPVLENASTVDASQLSFTHLHATVDDGCCLRLNGHAESVVAVMSSGTIDAASCSVDNADITVTGTGNAMFGDLKALNASCTGSGTIHWTGNPVLGHVINHH